MKEFKKTEDGLFVCEECGKTFKNKQGLSTHIKYHHIIKFYYDKYLKEEKEDLCKICNKPTKFMGIKCNGYSEYCSRKCITKQIQQNNILKYGVSCTLNTSKNIKKKKKTWNKNYGVDNPFSSPLIRNKIKQTYLDRYGVEYILQNKKILEKAQKTGLSLKQFKDTKLWYQGSYELDFLEKYFSLYPDITRGPSIKYKFEGKNRVYHPDFYIPSLNLIVECKNSWHAKIRKEGIEAKAKATIANGFNYIMIVDKDYSKLYLTF